MSHDYPERDVVMKCISVVEANIATLKAFADGYIEVRNKYGPKDDVAIESAKLVPHKATELEGSQIQLSQHLPKMLAVGDQASWLVAKSMEANDAAAAYAQELKSKICPELFPDDDKPKEAVTTESAEGMVTIKTMTGKLVLVSAEPSATIGTIKSRYQDSEGVPPDQQRLLFKGNQLKDDEATLSECNISPGDTLHLVLCLRQVESGGGGGGGGGSGARASACCAIQ